VAGWANKEVEEIVWVINENEVIKSERALHKKDVLNKF
jgi:hypothetical protein